LSDSGLLKNSDLHSDLSCFGALHLWETTRWAFSIKIPPLCGLGQMQRIEIYIVQGFGIHWAKKLAPID